MKLTKNKEYLQQKISRNVLVPETAVDFTPRVSKSYVPFTCKFPMVMHLVPILPRWCRSKTNFYVFSYNKACLKFCASFRFFLAVFMEKYQKNPLSELCEKRNSCPTNLDQSVLHLAVCSHRVWEAKSGNHNISECAMIFDHWIRTSQYLKKM